MSDQINHPSHYTKHPSGIECIQITEHMNFNLGNAVKYIWRAGQKTEFPVIDLKKAIWYLEREVERIAKEKMKQNPSFYGKGEKELKEPLEAIREKMYVGEIKVVRIKPTLQLSREDKNDIKTAISLWIDRVMTKLANPNLNNPYGRSAFTDQLSVYLHELCFEQLIPILFSSPNPDEPKLNPSPAQCGETRRPCNEGEARTSPLPGDREERGQSEGPIPMPRRIFN